MKFVIRHHLRIVATILVVSFFVLWLGVPTFNKWRADRLVDELCAKDGGIKVYETVYLPKDRFNRWGQFNVLGKDVKENNDEYYRVLETQDIVGNHNSSEVSELTVYRIHLSVYREDDDKLLGEGVGYTRRGGDPISPFHPSSYSCPESIGSTLAKKIFKKLKRD